MRCSECLGEIVQKPEGLVCNACGASVQVHEENGEVLREIEPALQRRGVSNSVIVVCGLLVAVIGAMYWLWQNPRAVNIQNFSSNLAEPEITSLAMRDEARLIAYEGTLLGANNELRVLGVASCQKVPVNADPMPLHISWFSLPRAFSVSVSPQLPDNWRLTAACRSETGRIFVLAGSADGVVLSALGQDGAILWTRLLPSDQSDAELFVSTGETDKALILTRAEANSFELRVFDHNGEGLWRRTLTNVVPGTAPVLATNRVGDIVIAWNDGQGVEKPVLRLLSLSEDNTVNYNQTYTNRTVELVGLASDNVANVYVLEGAKGFSVQKLRVDGSTDWRRWLDADARPIGIVVDGEDLVVAAHKDQSLMFWRVHGLSGRSAQASVELDGFISKALLETIDYERSRLTLTMVNGEWRQVLINLVRLREAAAIDAADIISSLDAPPEIDTLLSAELLQTDMRVPESESVLGVAAMVESDEVPQAEEASLEVITEPELSVVEDAISSEPLVSDTRFETRSADRPESISTDATTASASSPAASEMSCTFSCAATGNLAATYPMTQNIALGESEPQEAFKARLEQIHAQICSDSGGQPLAESLPDCVAQ